MKYQLNQILFTTDPPQLHTFFFDCFKVDHNLIKYQKLNLVLCSLPNPDTPKLSYFLLIFSIFFLLENIPLTCGVVLLPVQYNHSKNVFTLKNYLFNIQKLDFSVTCTLRYAPPRSVLRNKKRKKNLFFNLFYKYFIRTCTQTRG